MPEPSLLPLKPWHRSSLFMLPLLLAPLLTGCTIEQIAAPSQNRTAQAAGQTQPDPQASGSVKARAALEGPTAERPTDIAETEPTAARPETSPQPSQPIPTLMSQAASTAHSKLAPSTTTQGSHQDGSHQDGFHQGPLRVGNQTEHPLRIAFLAQGETAPNVEVLASEAAIAADPDAQNSGLPDPFHWDFAPDEGGSSGLLLALPEGDLALKDGDVIVAFAQDGSQRYWGPYVVGQTSLPHWNGDRDEWQLLVQP